MTRLEERIRIGLQETAERIPDTAPVATANRRRGVRPAGVWIAAAAIAAVLILFAPILFNRPDPDSMPAADSDSVPAIELDQFVGEWVTDQSDGTTHTMTIENIQASSADMNIEDDFALLCSDAPLQVTGTGTFRSDHTLVFSSPTVACKDGSTPEPLNGIPLEEQYHDLTFTYDPQTGTLTDNLGLLWTRGILNTPGINWPQTNLDEVQAAQSLADAGDPDYTWQLEPNMDSILQGEGQGETPEIYARFLQRELGWKEFVLIGAADTFEYGGFQVVGAQIIRCEPGKTNPIWPDDPLLGGCAPTIDDLIFESVVIYATQPDEQGPDGIWVASFLTEAGSFGQNAPITESEVAVVVDAFLQARIDGEGAEQYLGPLNPSHVEVGYLYTTSTGAPYESGEYEIEDGEIEGQGPLVGGAIGLKVRLFADDGQIVVEQTLEMEARGDQWLFYQHGADQTTENGVVLPSP